MSYVNAVQGPGYSVIYEDSKGEKFLFSGGTWAWRNHNPGNLRPGQISKKYGHIGAIKDQRGKLLAVFPTREAGHKALNALIKTHKYQALSLDEAIATYAPPGENNTASYQSQVRKKLNAPGDIKISELTTDQLQKLLNAIEHIEAWKEGKIEPVLQIQAIEKDKNHVIQGYMCASKWYPKKEAIELVLSGKLDATYCHSSKRKEYLRASHGNPPLDSLPTEKK